MSSVLSRVTYLLFANELRAGQTSLPSGDHSLDREIRLEASDGSSQYISWASEPAQYCVGVQSKSWFVEGDVVEIEMSFHEVWEPLVGRAVDLVWHDDSHQVLEIRAGLDSVYLSSREVDYWFADTITVSIERPAMPSNTSFERTREG